MSKIVNKETINKDKNVKYIKRFLRKHGGLLITNRQIGKTRALLELLHEDEDSFIIAFNDTNAQHMRIQYRRLFKDQKEDRIVSQNNATLHEVRYGYIDEYFFHNIRYKEFMGAVSTMSFPIKIRKFKNSLTENSFKGILTEEQFNMEHSLKFK